jgi:predicted ArsR family transcriptional regulator
VSTMQEQARALGDPTRHQIFRFVVDADRPVDVAELTAHLGLNHNAIRQHLAKLVDASLVVEGTAASTGRGRPRLVYVVDPAAESRWGVQGPYERLSLWLAEMVRTGESAREVGRAVGRTRRLGLPVTADPVDVLLHQMATHGFDPTLRRRGDAVEVTLHTCPFATTALADPDTICTLHLGIAEGLAERLDGLTVDELVRKDPRRAKCKLRAHLETPS